MIIRWIQIGEEQSKVCKKENRRSIGIHGGLPNTSERGLVQEKFDKETLLSSYPKITTTKLNVLLGF